MTLSFEQFNELRSNGLSSDQINRFEKGETPKQEKGFFGRTGDLIKDAYAQPVPTTDEHGRKDFIAEMYDQSGGDPVKKSMSQTMPWLHAVPNKVFRQGETSAFSYLNQRALNMPRVLLEKSGQVMPEENIIDRAAGIAGGFHSLGQGIPRQVARQGRRLPILAARKTSGKTRQVAKGISKFFSAPTRFQKLPSALVKGAVSGSIAAPLYTEKDKPIDIKGRLSRIPMGVALGATFGAGALVGSKVGKGLAAFKKRRVTGQQRTDIGPRLKSTQVLLEDKMKMRKARIKKLSKQRSRPIEEKIEKLSEKEKLAKSAFSQQAKVVSEKHSTFLADADKQLHNISQETGITLKKSVGDFRRSYNKVYGKHVDAISDKLANSGDDIMLSQVDEIVQATISDLTDDGVAISSKLKGLAKKYSMKVVNEAGEEIDVPDAPVKFRKLLNEMRQLTEGKEQVFTGTAQAKSIQRSELALKRNLGDYVASKDKTFAKLQAESRPVYERLKHLSKAIKPYSLETKPATTFTRKYAESAASGKQDKFTKESVDMIENGIKSLGEEIEGSGKFTAKAIKEAQKIAQSKKPLTTYNEQGKQQMASLKKVLSSIEQDLEDSLEKAQGRGFLGAARVNAIKDKIRIARRIYKWGGRIGTAIAINQVLNLVRQLKKKN